MWASQFTSKTQVIDQSKGNINQINISKFLLISVGSDIVISITIMYFLFFKIGYGTMHSSHGVASLFAPAFVSLMYVALKFARRGYRPAEYFALRRYLPNLLVCWSGALMFAVVAFYALGFGMDISGDWLAASFVTGLVFLPLGRAAVALKSGGDPTERHAFSRNAYMISAHRDAATLAIMRSALDEGTRIVGVNYLADDDAQARFGENCDALVEEIRKTLADTSIDEIYIRLPAEQRHRLNEVVSALSKFPIRVLLIGKPCADTSGHRSVRLGNHVAVELLSAPISARGHVAKRLLDITVASAALLVLLPVLAAACVGIALESGRPIIFRQNRRGVCGRPFTILKFRTMSVQENGDKIVQACRNDPRVTKLGAILRRTSIDELPQLLNVIRGDMSIVGPRPHALAHDAYYGVLIRDYSRRHNVKPGLTGWAQVNGFRGETRDLHAMSERVRHDIWYIENWSIGLDIRIIARTAGCVLFQKQAY